MKLLAAILIMCSISSLYGEVKVKLTPTKVEAAKGEILYLVEDDEVVVKDSIITNIIITKKVTVAYRNKTTKSLTPKYKIRFYNAYGFLLGEDKVGNAILFGSSTYMEPKEISSEKLYFDWYPLDNILQHSNIEIPNDFKKIKWIIISESNTQLPKKK